MTKKHLMPSIVSDIPAIQSDGSELQLHVPLYVKYKPCYLAEVVGHKMEIKKIEELLGRRVHFNCAGCSGIGVSTTLYLVLKKCGFFMTSMSCSVGFAETHRILNANMNNVLFALQNIKTSIAYVIRDIEVLNRSDKASLLKLVSELRSSVCIIVSSTPISSMDVVKFERPRSEEILEHLYWIASEECMEINVELFSNISSYEDIRTCINALGFGGQNRDKYDPEPFLNCLYAHETLSSDLDSVLTFADLLSNMDLCEYKPTREWFVSAASDFARDHFKIQNHQSHVARYAQICNRTGQLLRACSQIGISSLDMDQAGFIYKHKLLCEKFQLDKNAPESESKAKALYTIAKRFCKATESRQLKMLL